MALHLIGLPQDATQRARHTSPDQGRWPHQTNTLKRPQLSDTTSAPRTLKPGRVSAPHTLLRCDALPKFLIVIGAYGNLTSVSGATVPAIAERVSWFKALDITTSSMAERWWSMAVRDQDKTLGPPDHACQSLLHVNGCLRPKGWATEALAHLSPALAAGELGH